MPSNPGSTKQVRARVLIRLPLLLASLGLFAAGPGAAESLSGELAWAGQRTLSFALTGVVAEVVARPGESLRAGSPIARLEAAPFEARRARAQAKLDAAAPLLEEARRALDTAVDLYERTVISDTELREARAVHAAADAHQRELQASLQLAQLEFEHSVLRAPVDAIVLEVALAPGQLVVSGYRAEPHVTIAMAGYMDVYVPVAVETFSAVRLGDEVSITVQRQTYRAEVNALRMPSAAGPGAAFVLRFAHPPGQRYFPGYAVGVELP